MTWTFESGVRQTPSLAGPMSRTGPVTWTSAVSSVAEEAQITTAGRMGGQGASAEQAANIAAFVESTPLPQPPDVDDPDAVVRGEAVFHEVGCTTCHSGPLYTDNEHHGFGDRVATNTPPLAGVAATPPYLSDGRANTLRDVLELARNSGEMGSTATLTEPELDDLEAYLRSL